MKRKHSGSTHQNIKCFLDRKRIRLLNLQLFIPKIYRDYIATLNILPLWRSPFYPIDDPTIPYKFSHIKNGICKMLHFIYSSFIVTIQVTLPDPGRPDA